MNFPQREIRVDGWRWTRIDTVMARIYAGYAIGLVVFLLTGAPQ